MVQKFSDLVWDSLKWISLGLAVWLSLVGTLPVSAVAPGLQEYYILGYEEHIYRMYTSTGSVDGSDPDQRYMASIVDVTVTADGQVVYYDHWEDGYEADILVPQQTDFVTGTLILGDNNPVNGNAGDYTGRAADTLLAGDSLSFSSRYLLTATTGITGYVPVATRDAAYVRFDGGDRLVSTGGPVGLVHNIWPADLGATPPDQTWMGDAWEIYSTQALENGFSYRAPIGVNLSGVQFTNVDLQVQALEDNTTVSVGNGAVTATFVLDRGQTYFSKGYIDTQAFTSTLAVTVRVGTAIQADKPVQAGIIAYQGTTGGFQDRYYNMIPNLIWGRDYVMPVPDNGANAEVYIYNPNPYTITVTSADSNQTDNLQIPPASTVDYTTAAGAGVPTLSGIRLSSDAAFWAISAADSNSLTYDWGTTFIPQVFLTDEYYASWAPGNVLQPPLQSTCNTSGNSGGSTLCRNSSPLWVAAVEDGTMVNVDYNNDDIVDQTFTLGMFDVRLLRDDADFDQSGAHVWTESGQKIAIIWGEDPAMAGPSTPNLDVGHLVLPLYQGWLTPPIYLEKTASPEILPPTGGTVEFKLTTTAAYFAELDNVVITDTLPYSWTYVSDSAVITYPDGSATHFEPIITTNAGWQSLYWNLASEIGPEQPLVIAFQASLAMGNSIEAQHFDGFESNTYTNGSGPWLDDWTEVNETTNPGAGAIRIVGTENGVAPHDGARQLRLAGVNTGTDPSIYRSVNLSSFVHPILSLDRYFYGLETGDTFGVDVSNDNGASYTPVLTWTNTASPNLWVGEEVDLSDYRAVNVRIRLRSVSNTSTSDYVYFDNVEIHERLAVNTNLAQAQAGYRDHVYTVTDRKTVYLSPFKLTKSASASEAHLGDTLVFTLTYENASGAVTGTQTVLRDMLSPGFNFVAASHGGLYTAATNTIQWTLGDLPPASQSQVVFTVTVNTTTPPDDGDVVENAAQLFSSQSHIRSNTVAVTIRAPRLVNVIKTAPGNASPGDVITYTLSLQNAGTLTATHTLITDTLTAYLTYAPDTCAPACTLLSGGRVLQWDLGDVAPGALIQLSFAAQISETTPVGTLIQNTAEYRHAALSDPRATNTAATLISLVTLHKHADQTLVGPDATVSITLDYANVGGITQTAVLITDPIPEYTAYIAGSATGSAGVITPTYSADGGATYQTSEPADAASVTHLRWEIAALLPGSSNSLHFQVRVASAAQLPNATSLRNQATLTSEQTTRLFSNQLVLPTVKLALDKLGPAIVTPGVPLTYTLRLGNYGSGAATAILSDTLPADVVFLSAAPSPAATVPLTWAVTLPANTTNLDYTVVVSVPAGLPVGTELRNTAGLSTAQHAVADAHLTYIASPDITLIPNNTGSAAQGETLYYAHTVFNNNAVTDTVALTVAHSLWTSPTLTLYRDVNGNGQYEATTDTPLADTDSDFIPDTGPLPSGSLARFLVCVIVPLDVADGSINVTTLRASSTALPGRYSEATDTTAILVGAGLTLAKSQVDADGAPLYPGDALTYTLVLVNADAITHTDVILTDTAPTGISFTGGDLQPGGVLTVTADAVTATIASLTPGARVTVTLAAALAATADTGLLTNTAYANSTQQAAPVSAASSGMVEGLTLAKSAVDENSAPLYVGDVVQYVITVTNASTVTTQTGVVVTDSLPAGVAFVSANPTPASQKPLVWSLGTLAAGVSWTATVRVTVDGSADPIGANVAQVSSDQQVAQSSDPVLPPSSGGGGGDVDPGLSLTKTATDENGAPLYVGDVVQYVITVTNASTQTAQTGVMVTDSLPAGVVFLSANPTPASQNPLVWNVGTLAPGASWTATVRVTVDGSADPIGANVAQVSSDQQAAQPSDPVLPPGSGGGDVTPITGLGVVKTAIDENGAPLYVGDVVQYVITVTNASTQTAQTGVVVTDSLPAGVAFASANPAPASQNPLVWNVGTLTPSASWTATVRVTVDGSADPIGANVAQVSSDQQAAQSSDPVLPPGSGGGDVTPITGLGVAKSAVDENGAPLYVGDVVRYVITVTNASTQTAQTGVVVTDSLPAGVAFASANPASASQNPLVWNVGSLAPGASWTATVRVTVDGSADPIGANVAQVSSNQQAAQSSDPVLPPGSGGGDVTPITGLGVVKTALDENGAPLYFGDVVQYVITVTNASTQTTQTGIVVTDSLPSGVVFVSANPAPASQTPLVWTVGTLAPGASWTAIVHVTVDGSADPIGANVAQVSSDQQAAQSSDPVLPPGSGGDVTPISGLGLVKTATDENGAPLYIGDIVQYVITVTNASTVTTQTGVVVTDSLPAGVAFVSANPAPASQTPLVWTVGTLAPGATWTATVRVTVDGSADPIGANVAQVGSDQQAAQSSDPVLPPGSGGGDVTPISGLGLVKTAVDKNGAPLYIGDVVQYVITITNASTVTTQTGVVVTDSLPAGVAFVSANPAPASQTPLVWTVGTLAPGATWTATVRVTVDGSADPIGANVAQVSSDQQTAQFSDPVLPPGGGGDVTPITGLGLAKTALDENGAPLYVGDVVQYVITVTNASTQTTQTGVVVTDSLPAGVAFVSANPTPAFQNPLVWNVGTLAPGASWTAIVRITVDGSADPIGANVAQVRSDQQTAQASDPVLPPGSDGGDVTPITGLGIAKSAVDENGAPLYIGDVVQYVITVTNASTQTIQTGVVLTDGLPAGVAFASANPAPASQNPLVWNIGTLAPGASWTATVRVTVDGSANPIGANVAQVSSDQQAAQGSNPALPPGGGNVENPSCAYGADAYEEDDTPATAHVIVADINQTRNFFDDATDWIALTAGASDTYTITTVVEGANADTALTLYDRDGQTVLVENDNYGAGGLSSRIVWTATYKGVYYLRVTNQGGLTGCETHYMIQMTVHDVTIVHLPLVIRAHR